MSDRRYYEIVVREPMGTLVDIITAEYVCRWALHANKVGVLVLELPSEYCSPISTFGIGEFGEDFRIELRRYVDGVMSLVGKTCFFINYLAVVQGADGKRTLRIEAESALGLAGRRTISYRSNNDASDLEPKLADNQLKRVMRDHFGTIAASYNFPYQTDDPTRPGDPLRQAIAPYITIDYPPGPGLSTKTIEMNVAHQPVLQALGRIADTSFTDGEALFFDIQQIDDVGVPFLEFVTAIGQLGVDRTVTTGGVNQVVLDARDSASPINDYTFALDYRESAYRIYAGSQGRGAQQTFGYADTPGLTSYIAVNPFGLREAYIGTNEKVNDANKLNDQASAQLARLLPKIDVHGTLSENESFVWGVDWDWQDRLTVLADGVMLDVWIEGLEGELSGGQEQITATFSTTLHRGLDGIARVVQDTKRLDWWVKHLSSLETGTTSLGVPIVTGSQVVASGYQYLVQGALTVDEDLTVIGEMVVI